jgi:hypothetical protein
MSALLVALWLFLSSLDKVHLLAVNIFIHLWEMEFRTAHHPVVVAEEEGFRTYGTSAV